MKLQTFCGKTGRSIAVVLLLALTMSAFSVSAPAVLASSGGNPNPSVLPVNSNPQGLSYGQWSALWTKLELQQIASESPILDQTGAGCHFAQPAKHVFFLAGSFGQTVTRTCTIPSGMMLFFPIVEDENGYIPFCPTCSVQALRDSLDPFVISVTELHASVDGVQLTHLFSYRVPSTVFNIVFPDTNINDCPNCNLLQFFGSDVTGVTGPWVADGFWVMLAPLSPGQHTINFGGSQASTGFSLDVTYQLTVEQ